MDGLLSFVVAVIPSTYHDEVKSRNPHLAKTRTLYQAPNWVCQPLFRQCRPWSFRSMTTGNSHKHQIVLRVLKPGLLTRE